jgi:hypothetical protein
MRVRMANPKRFKVVVEMLVKGGVSVILSNMGCTFAKRMGELESGID